MKLKRILSKQTVQKRDAGKDTKAQKSENLLFRTSGGLCFDVCPDDRTMYYHSYIVIKKVKIEYLLDIYVALKKVSFIDVLYHIMNNI